MSAHDHRSHRGHAAGVAGAAALAGYMLPGAAAAWPTLRRPLGIEDRTASGTGYALTFDDGPHPQGTPRVLEVLAQENVTATFFLVGERVQADPGLARELTAAGHHIGLHCQRHRNLLRLGPRQTRADIEMAYDVITEHCGRPPSVYRPPYGILNASAMWLASSRGWRILLWSHWGRDWEAGATPSSIASRVTDGAGPGAMLLLHDGDHYSAPGSWRSTVAALPRVLEVLAERGLDPVAP